MKKNIYKFFNENRFVLYIKFLMIRIKYFKINQLASSLTYTTLFTLIPSIVLFIYIFSFFPLYNVIYQNFEDIISHFLAPSGLKIVSQYINTFTTKAPKLSLASIPIIILPSIIILISIENKFNEIWQVTTHRKIYFRIILYLIIILFLPILFAYSFYFWTSNIKPILYNYIFFTNINSSLIYLIYLILILTFFYTLFPLRYVPLKHAFFTSIIVSFILEICRKIFILYVKYFNSMEFFYGAFTFLPLFLIWLYCLWFIVLSGAVLTSSLSYLKHNAFKKPIFNTHLFDDIIKVLILIYKYDKKNKRLTLKKIRENINAGYDVIGKILERLEFNQYIYKSFGKWNLKKMPNEIILEDIFQRFIYTPDKHSNHDYDNNISTNIDLMIKPGMENLKISLFDFIKILDSKIDDKDQK